MNPKINSYNFFHQKGYFFLYLVYNTNDYFFISKHHLNIFFNFITKNKFGFCTIFEISYFIVKYYLLNS